MKKLSFLSLCFSVAILFASCTKEGPMGPVGPQGAQGPTGSSGAQGQTGTANVLYSNWSTSSLEWSNDANATLQKLATLTATGLTQEVLDRGMVLVYSRNNADGDVHPLPVIINTTDTSTGTSITTANRFRFALRAGAVSLMHTSEVAGAAVAPQAADVNFRYIIVPGSSADSRISSGAAGYTTAQLQAMSYNQIVALFRIPK